MRFGKIKEGRIYVCIIGDIEKEEGVENKRKLKTYKEQNKQQRTQINEIEQKQGRENSSKSTANLLNR